MFASLIFAAGEPSGVFGPLNPANAPSLIFWGVVTFAISYFFLAPRLMNRAEEVIEDREGQIKGDLAAAEKANAEAEALLKEYEAKLDTARADASTAVRAELADADKKSIAAENRLSKKILKQTAEAEDGIRAAMDAASSDLSDTAATTAQMAVQRLAGLKVTKTVAKAAVKANG